MEELYSILKSYRKKKYSRKLFNSLIRSLMVTVGLWVILFLVEYIFRLSSQGRFVLFYLGMGLSCILLLLFNSSYVIRLFRKLSKDDYLRFAKEIGDVNSQISDSWLNALQLEENKGNSALAIAALKSKIATVNQFKLSEILLFSRSEKRFLFGSGIILVIILSTLLIPNEFRNAGIRISEYDIEKESFAPFSFVHLDDDILAFKGDNLKLELFVKGKELPEVVQLYDGDVWIKELEYADSSYNLFIPNLSKDLDLNIRVDDYVFEYGNVILFEPFKLTSLSSLVSPMEYTKLLPFKESRQNYRVPIGSKVEIFGLASIISNEEKHVVFDAISDTSLVISWDHPSMDTVMYVNLNLRVIEDAYPSIKVSKDNDVYNLDMNDDYLVDNFQVIFKSQTHEEVLKNLVVKEKSGSFAVKEKEMVEALKSGTKGEVFFRVFDNDGFNGKKYSDSPAFSIYNLSDQELKELDKMERDAYANDLSNSKKELNSINNEMNQLNDKVKQGEKLDWSDVLKLQELESKRRELLRNEAVKVQDKNTSYSDDIKKKEEEIRALRESIFDEEFMKELEELSKDLSKEDLKSELERWEEENTSIEENLDRELDWLKELEVEKLTEDLIKELDSLSANLSKESLPKWDSIKTELDSLSAMNEEIDFGLELDSTMKQSEQTDEAVQEAMDSPEQNAMDEAKESVKKLKESLESSLSSQRENSVAEDAESLRRILDGLVKVSEDEESIFVALTAQDETSQIFKRTYDKHLSVNNDWVLLKDSLNALADRQPAVAKILYDKLANIDLSQSNIQANWTTGKVSNVIREQHSSMMYFNDLALMLSQIMDAMNMEMNSKKSGKGKCDNPGGAGAKPGKGKMSKMQKGMQKQMEQLIKQRGEGKSKGNGESGKPNGSRGGSNGKELMKLALQQQMIREAMQEAMKNLSGDGSSEAQELLDEMSEIEKDILNNNVSGKTIDKTRELESKLLEFEEAFLEQGEDEKRESASGNLNQEETDFNEYFEKQKLELEELKLKQWQLQDYYNIIQ